MADRCKAAFDALTIPWECIDHAPVLTVEEGLMAADSTGASFAKNLFVKDKKAGLFLITTTADRKVDMKKLPALLGVTGANFRFADGAVLQEKLGVKQGAVTPLAVMNDVEGEVTLVLDQELMAAAKARGHRCSFELWTSCTLLSVARCCFLSLSGSDMTYCLPPSASSLLGGRASAAERQNRHYVAHRHDQVCRALEA